MVDKNSADGRVHEKPAAHSSTPEHAGTSQPSKAHDQDAHHHPETLFPSSSRARHQGPDEPIDHTGHEPVFRQRFWVCVVISIPVLLYSPMIQMLVGFRMPPFPGSAFITPIFSTIIFIYGGLLFLRMAVPELRTRQPGMMTLISLAISVAFIFSLANLFFNLGGDFFWELVTLIDIMLLGHWLEMRSLRQASGALNELARLMPDTAERIDPQGETAQAPVSALRNGNLVLVRPGASLPADGTVESGDSEVNEAMLTGESRPVKKRPGDKVIAGTINQDGSLRVRVGATGQETALAGILRLVQEAQQSKSHTQVLADKAAGWLFYAALIAASLTAVGWIWTTGWRVQVIERVVTVLVIACPHALGLAIPLVVAITTALGASRGILIRDRRALETLREINVVVFDKTGTLTLGEQRVVGVAALRGWDEMSALSIAAAVEGDSEHILARAIRQAAKDRKLGLPAAQGFEAIKGRGAQAEINEKRYAVGGPRLLEQLNTTLPAELMPFTGQANQSGQTVVYLAEQEQVVAGFALADVIRPESKPAVDQLNHMGIQVILLTGDSQAVAQAVSTDLGIQTYLAEVLPEDKEQQISDLARQGKRVAMVGDGVNDAPALARADVGIAIGSGTDVAVESAGVILVKNNPLDVPRAIELSRASYRKMVQNLVWATGYNVVAIPLAAGMLAPVGILLSPAAGALLMSASTIIVALNAQLLRRVKQ